MMLSDKEFEALATYYFANGFGDGWKDGSEVLKGSENVKLESMGWIERLTYPIKSDKFRITARGITAYWTQKYHYAKDTIDQIHRLTRFTVTRPRTPEEFKHFMDLLLMITTGKVEWTEDNRIKPYSNKPVEVSRDETG